MNRLDIWVVGLAVLGCADSGLAPTTHVVSAGEKAALQEALALAFGDDSVYTVFSAFVLPFIDQATPQGNPSGDTTKLAGFQLEATAGRITGGFSGVLAWRGYHAATETVDSVFLVFGAGLVTPLSDSLSQTFVINLLGSGSGWVIAEAPDSSVRIWLARAGALSVTNATFGAGTTADLGNGFTITRSRGAMAGAFHLTAKLVPDSATTVMGALDFAGSIESVKLLVAGPATLTASERAPARAPRW